MFFSVSKNLLKLAFPVILSHIGIIATIIVDTVLVAHYSATELAYFNAANIIYFFVITIMAGFVQGVAIAVSNVFGAKEYYKCGSIVIKSIPMLFMICACGLTIHFLGSKILIFLKVDPTISSGADNILKFLGVSFIPCVIYFILAYFLESIKKPMIVAIVVVITNIINAFLSWIFIFGKFGFSDMGAAGAGLSTLISVSIAAISLLLYVAIFMKDKCKFFNAEHIKIKYKYKFFIIGLGIASVLAAEEIGYSSNMIFASWISRDTLAAYGIMMNFFMISLAISVGLASATSIMCGIYNGEKNLKKIIITTIASVIMHLLFALILLILIIASKGYVTSLYTTDKSILALTYGAVYIVVIIVAIDGAQIIISNALRGVKFIFAITCTQIISSVGVMIPLAFVFTMYFKMQITGLLLAVVCSSSCSLLMLSCWFMYMVYKKKQLPDFNKSINNN